MMYDGLISTIREVTELRYKQYCVIEFWFVCRDVVKIRLRLRLSVSAGCGAGCDCCRTGNCSRWMLEKLSEPKYPKRSQF